MDATRDCVSVDRRNFIEVINSNDEWIWFPSIPLTHFMQTPACVIQTAISEMLLQSHEEVIRIAPAVPPQFDGTFVLFAQGGFEVTARIESGRVLFAVIRAEREGTCRVENPWHQNGDGASIVLCSTGESAQPDVEGAEYSFEAQAGEEYLLLATSGEKPDEAIRPCCEPRRSKPRYGHGRWIGIDREY
jgi:hypothetical protein